MARISPSCAAMYAVPARLATAWPLLPMRTTVSLVVSKVAAVYTRPPASTATNTVPWPTDIRVGPAMNMPPNRLGSPGPEGPTVVSVVPGTTGGTGGCTGGWITCGGRGVVTRDCGLGRQPAGTLLAQLVDGGDLHACEVHRRAGLRRQAVDLGRVTATGRCPLHPGAELAVGRRPLVAQLLVVLTVLVDGRGAGELWTRPRVRSQRVLPLVDQTLQLRPVAERGIGLQAREEFVLRSLHVAKLLRSVGQLLHQGVQTVAVRNEVLVEGRFGVVPDPGQVRSGHARPGFRVTPVPNLRVQPVQVHLLRKAVGQETLGIGRIGHGLGERGVERGQVGGAVAALAPREGQLAVHRVLGAERGTDQLPRPALALPGPFTDFHHVVDGLVGLGEPLRTALHRKTQFANLPDDQIPALRKLAVRIDQALQLLAQATQFVGFELCDVRLRRPVGCGQRAACRHRDGLLRDGVEVVAHALLVHRHAVRRAQDDATVRLAAQAVIGRHQIIAQRADLLREPLALFTRGACKPALASRHPVVSGLHPGAPGLALRRGTGRVGSRPGLLHVHQLVQQDLRQLRGAVEFGQGSGVPARLQPVGLESDDPANGLGIVGIGELAPMDAAAGRQLAQFSFFAGMPVLAEKGEGALQRLTLRCRHRLRLHRAGQQRQHGRQDHRRRHPESDTPISTDAGS